MKIADPIARECYVCNRQPKIQSRCLQLSARVCVGTSKAHSAHNLMFILCADPGDHPVQVAEFAETVDLICLLRDRGGVLFCPLLH
jgi:hypothetical protein